MKYIFIFIRLSIAQLLILSCNCFAMKNPFVLSKTMTALEKKHSCYNEIEFLSNHSIIFRNKKDKFIFFDFSTNTKKIITSSVPDTKLMVHPQKHIFALITNKDITFYNAHSLNKEKTIELPLTSGNLPSCVFSQSDKSMFIWLNSNLCARGDGNWYIKHKKENLPLLHYDYEKNSIQETGRTYDYLQILKMDVHPYKKELYVTEYSTFDYPTVVDMHDLDAPCPNFPDNCTPLRNCWFVRYSPDGSVVTRTDGFQVDISTTDSYATSHTYTFKPHAQYDLYSIAFTPNSSFLIVLSREENRNILYYLDSRKKKIVARTELDYIAPGIVTKTSFSPNGKKVLCVFHREAIIMDVPFKIHTHHQLPYFLFLLKKISEYHQAPKEITYMIMNTLLNL